MLYEEVAKSSCEAYEIMSASVTVLWVIELHVKLKHTQSVCRIDNQCSPKFN